MRIFKVLAVIVAIAALLLAQVTSIPSAAGGFSGTIDASQVVSGRFIKARQNDQTVYADQSITYANTSDQDMRLGQLRPPQGLFSAIPAASSFSGGYYIVTDGNGSNCTAGGGSTATACYSNGTSWVLISGTGSTANPTVTFTSQTSVTFTHNLNTDTPIIQCYDNSGSRIWVEPSQITSTSVNASTITFATSQSGKCAANATGGAGGGGGGSGTVTSVGMTVPAWLAVSGSPITSSGTLAVTLSSASGARSAILPSYAGNASKVLAVNAGATDVEWITGGGGGGGTPGGSSGQVQFNSSGSFAGRTCGTGFDCSGTNFQVSTATVPTYLTASSSLDFGSISQSACAELTISLTGAGTTDSVAAGWPSDFDAGLVGTMYVSATNVVTVRLCKITSGAVDPASKSYRATIVRSF